MKLYYAPGACSLADHIALREAGVDFELEKVDIKRKVTASGGDFTAINPKGYVPALALDNGEIVTENIAVLDWIATQSPSLGLDGPLGRTRLLETLAYISTEVHKAFKPFFSGVGDDEKAKARAAVAKRLKLLGDARQGPFLFGQALSVADCYLFVMLLWAGKFEVAVPHSLAELAEEMLTRPSVQKAMAIEGLSWTRKLPSRSTAFSQSCAHVAPCLRSPVHVALRPRSPASTQPCVHAALRPRSPAST